MKTLVRAVFAATALLLYALQATGQTWPAKPIRIVVPYAAGGGPDVQARQLSTKLSMLLDSPVVVVNQVGAGGALGAQAVQASNPDGYTLLLGSNTQMIQKQMHPKLQFDPVAGFAAVSLISQGPVVMLVLASSPFRSLDDVLRAAKESRGQVKYASGGLGTPAHLAAATLESLEGVSFTHVPLRGSVEVLPTLMRGDVEFAFTVAATALPLLNSGKLRALAVSSRARLEGLPNTPTLFEATRQELLVQEHWFGLWAPKGTPTNVIERLHAATRTALADQTLRDQFRASGAHVRSSETPQDFDEFMRTENQRWKKLTELSGLKAE